jgi:hypothetical protein
MKQSGQQFALREIAGRANEHDDLRIFRAYPWMNFAHAPPPLGSKSRQSQFATLREFAGLNEQVWGRAQIILRRKTACPSFNIVVK